MCLPKTLLRELSNEIGMKLSGDFAGEIFGIKNNMGSVSTARKYAKTKPLSLLDRSTWLNTRGILD